MAVSQIRHDVGHDPALHLRSSPRASRLAPRPFFCKTRGGAGRSSDETRYIETKYIKKTDGSDQTNTLRRGKKKEKKRETKKRRKGEVDEGGRKMVKTR